MTDHKTQASLQVKKRLAMISGLCGMCMRPQQIVLKVDGTSFSPVGGLFVIDMRIINVYHVK